jgi:RimJ/RimL family protein N-acetyltransferase
MANIEKLWTEFIKNAICRYAVVLKETNEFIGWANIKFNVTGKRPSYFYEIGYRLREEFWGKAMVMKLQKLGYILALLK